MPENKQIHDLPIAEQTSSSDLFETEIPSQLMQSGFASRKVSAAEIADLMLNDMTYPQALQTTAKKIIPAINEAAQSGGGGGASVVQKTMAEYNALPTEAKMNGSIYKITDKALIYCLDEEYHALKEITSADYAQLTSDKKNNGTLYILTDEETTAADIPYSAGVSVADKIADMTTYSTTEKAVGTWVDGSVLYEKTIEVDNPTSTVVSIYDYYQIYENNDNAKYVFVTSAFFTRANDNRCIALPHNRLYQANNIIDYEAFCDLTTNKTTIAVFKPTALNVSIGKVSITIRYTKSV